MKKLTFCLLFCVATFSLASCGKENTNATAPVEQEEAIPTGGEEAITTENEEAITTENEETTPTETETNEQQGLLQCVSDINSFEGILTMSVKMQIPMSAAEKEEYEKLGNDASYAYHNINMCY